MKQEVQNISNKPFVSIIVASYNYGRYIRDNLNSLLNQTYDNFEVIIIDDGSTDDSVDIINEYVQKDNRFKLLLHEDNANMGLSKSIYFALSYTKGDYIAFCESDDYWTFNHLEKYVDYIAKLPETDFLTARAKIILDGKYKGQTQVIDTYNNGFFSHYKLMRTIEKPKNLFYPMLKTYTFPTFSVVMVKSEKIKKCDFFPLLINGLDLYLWKQLGFTCKIGFIDEQLTFWRRSGESLIHEKQNTELLFSQFKKTLNSIGGYKQNIKNKAYKFLYKIKHFIYQKKIRNSMEEFKILGVTVSKHKITIKDFS